MQIPPSFLDELRARVDLVAVVSAHLTLKRTGHNLMACCPFHQEKTPSFTVNAKRQRYHCFGCGADGDAIQFLRLYENIDFVEAVRRLATSVGLTVPTTSGVESKYQRHRRLYDLHDLAVAYYHQQLLSDAGLDARNYLQARGVKPETVQQFQVGYAKNQWDGLLRHAQSQGFSEEEIIMSGLGVVNEEKHRHYDRFRHRVLFPIRDRHGRYVGFGGRALDDQNLPKYLNSPQTPLFHKGEMLYGLYDALHAGHPTRIMVVEGYMDVLALVQSGFPQVVATLGTALTIQHLNQLFRVTDQVLFCFDGDRAGRRAAWKALITVLPMLNEQHQAAFLFLPDGQDPDSLLLAAGPEAMHAQLTHAQPASQFLLQTLKNHYDLRTTEGRGQFIHHTTTLISKIPSHITKQLLTEEVASAARTSISALQPQKTTTPARSRSSMQKTLTVAERLGSWLLWAPQLSANVQIDFSRHTILPPDLANLRDLLRLMAQQPELTTEELILTINQWAGGEQMSAHVAQLAAVPLSQLTMELQDAVQQIQLQLLELEISHYLQRLNNEGLSTAERQHLSDLLRNRTHFQLV